MCTKDTSVKLHMLPLRRSARDIFSLPDSLKEPRGKQCGNCGLEMSPVHAIWIKDSTAEKKKIKYELKTGW